MHKRINDVANVYRSRPGERIPIGSSIIRLSANDGSVEYAEKEKEGAQGYVVIEPCEGILPKYLFFAIQKEMPKFLARYKTCINLKFDALKYLKINVQEKEKQRDIVDMFEKVDLVIKREEEIVDRLEKVKRWHLKKMFVEGK